MFCKLLSRSGGVGSSTDRRAIDERHAAVRVNGAINEGGGLEVEENEEPVSPWKRDTCEEAVV